MPDQGARVHHVTLKVPALLPAVDRLRDDGFDVVDVSAEGDVWHEGFLRPSQVGGLIVQIAWSGRSDDEWAELAGMLGAEVEGDADGRRVAWPEAPLDVEGGPRPGGSPLGLRFVGANAHPGDGQVGPPTLPAVRAG